ERILHVQDRRRIVDMKVAVSEAEIKKAYAGSAVADQYVDRRFSSELMRVAHDKQVEAVQRANPRVGSGRILEIAPGPGRSTCDVRAGGRLCCLEYNQQMIERGRSVCQENVRWIQGDAFNLPFSSSFDLVYSFRFVRHFQRSDRDRLYRQIRQVLKPAGWLVL